MLTQETALEYLTLYRSAYDPVYADGVATPRSATVHTPASRRVAETAIVALVDACRPLSRSLWRNHAHSLDEDTVESILYESVLVKSFVYDPAGSAKFTSWLGRVLRNAYIDELRKLAHSRDAEDAVITYTVSPLSDEDNRRSILDEDAALFASTTAASSEDEVRALIPELLGDVRAEATERKLDADLIVQVAVDYLLARFDGEAPSRADIAASHGMSEWQTRKVTTSAEDILRGVLSNRLHPIRMTDQDERKQPTP